VLVWDKKNRKYTHLLRLAAEVRHRRYDLVVNLQRFFSTGFLTAVSGAKTKVCFDKNPLAAFATHRQPHRLGTAENPVHEVDRNQSLIAEWTDNQAFRPKLYPSAKGFADFSHLVGNYITISPASVWPTKQLPKEKWVKLMDGVGEGIGICLLGGKDDVPLCEAIKASSKHRETQVMAGRLSYLESANLMQGALMNYVNDSAPLHFASAVNAPVTAVFCSTVPAFGFGPLSEVGHVVETGESLPCRPCGLHGKKACPLGHFKCSEIDVSQLLAKLK
jgi:heptosyltransferase-2